MATKLDRVVTYLKMFLPIKLQGLKRSSDKSNTFISTTAVHAATKLGRMMT